ncbi:hypothetical protein Tco_0333376 [Tanacetum coccineum]
MSLLTPSDIQHSAATQIWGCYRLVSEPRGLLGSDDEKIFEGGIPRVIVLGYDRLPMQPPLPPVDSPTAESPEYVIESDPEEDPEEYEDDEIEDGPVDYPMDGGDDRDDDDDDSSGDDADGEDEDDEGRREKEEALAPADSAIVLYLLMRMFSLRET